MLNVRAGRPGSKSPGCISTQPKCIGRKTEKQVREGMAGKDAAGELILAAAIQIQRGEEWKIPQRRADLRYGRCTLKRNVIQQLEASITAFLRKIRRVTQVGQTRNQNGRSGRRTVFKNRPGLLQVVHREAELMYDRGRENMRVVEAHAMSLQRIAGAEGWEV